MEVITRFRYINEEGAVNSSKVALPSSFIQISFVYKPGYV